MVGWSTVETKRKVSLGVLPTRARALARFVLIQLRGEPSNASSFSSFARQRWSGLGIRHGQGEPDGGDCSEDVKRRA